MIADDELMGGVRGSMNNNGIGGPAQRLLLLEHSPTGAAVEASLAGSGRVSERQTVPSKMEVDALE